MPGYLVELRGESREVYYVEADSEEMAEERWMTGDLQVQESSSMEIFSIQEDDIQ
jgi:hypothetical protein